MSRVPTETKARILLSARNLFSNYGLTATSLADILDATGITKGAFYHYFDSKEHVCQQILQDVITEYQQLYETIDTQRPAAEQLRQWLAMLVERNQSGQWLNCRFILQLSVQIHQLGPALQNQMTDFWRWYEGIYENWLMQCGLKDREANISARTLISVLLGAIWLEKSHPGPHSITDIVQHQMQLILHVE